ncbi:hypothetical protein PYW07_000294 [Mythimna separata]|uniref:Uncharacterized protein n=1 Tax=Mythimna separata TaxID=271217 RepID=A0AAD7Z3X2_MYTSE|nr:hypothetical protein PYW07_000294 [Mythimna separata]
MQFVLSLALVASSEAFFLKWGSDSASQSSAQKTWVQPLPPNMSPGYRYQYTYTPYESRKVYQIQSPQYQQPEMVQQNLQPIPISVPAGSSLTPVSLQHVQLVPCMCPVAPEEAEKLQEQVGPGPYMAQTYSQPSYTVPQQVSGENVQNTNKQ